MSDECKANTQLYMCNVLIFELWHWSYIHTIHIHQLYGFYTFRKGTVETVHNNMEDVATARELETQDFEQFQLPKGSKMAQVANALVASGTIKRWVFHELSYELFVLALIPRNCLARKSNIHLYCITCNSKMDILFIVYTSRIIVSKFVFIQLVVMMTLDKTQFWSDHTLIWGTIILPVLFVKLY